ncbi:MAG: hypothetical protein JZU65_13205, partial [Chlorobium sp.]|nr:hypothetical protein [Chlorobium sp.]
RQLFLSAKPEKTNCQFPFAQIRVIRGQPPPLHPSPRHSNEISPDGRDDKNTNSSLNPKTKLDGWIAK